jgi:hypothetical protein
MRKFQSLDKCYDEDTHPGRLIRALESNGHWTLKMDNDAYL